jgi:DNA-binding NarL/FixJ family response regulator
VRTVDHHVARIYAKLGVASRPDPRVAATAYALRSGLAAIEPADAQV